MPRKLRQPKTRRGPAIQVPKFWFTYLLWGDDAAARAQAAIDGDDFAQIYFRERYRPIWFAMEEQALVRWTDVYPGTRPPSWWEWSARDLRQLIGGRYRASSGAGRSWPTGVPYIAQWEDEPPMVETTPAYLTRLNLWLPGERARVDPDAFTPQPFSIDLTWVPSGMPEDCDEEGVPDDNDEGLDEEPHRGS